MSADVNRYKNLPGNRRILVVVDAWWFKTGPTTGGMRFKLNRVLLTTEGIVQISEYAATPSSHLVAGSVKMGQPIEHPETKWLGVKKNWSNSTTNTDVVQALFNWTGPTKNSPTGPMLLKHTHNGPPILRYFIGGPIFLSQMPLRPQAGGY